MKTFICGLSLGITGTKDEKLVIYGIYILIGDGEKESYANERFFSKLKDFLLMKVYC